MKLFIGKWLRDIAVGITSNALWSSLSFGGILGAAWLYYQKCVHIVCDTIEEYPYLLLIFIIVVFVPGIYCILRMVDEIRCRISAENEVGRMEVADKASKAEISSCMEKIKELASQLEFKSGEVVTLQQGIGEMFHKYLKHLSDSLGCGIRERLSLYLCKTGSDIVELMRRYPENGDVGKIGRTKHRIDEGVIGKVQREKHFYLSRLPDPAKNMDGYCRKQKKYFGYKPDEVKNFSMKARTYFSFRISKDDSNAGIIVLESLDKEFKDEESLLAEVSRHNEYIYNTISIFRSWIPTYEQAIKENF